MYSLEEMQKSFYMDRIGKVYGMFEVIDVEYDKEKRRQKWTMKCVNCGFVKTTYNGKDYVKGKNAGTCKCQRPKKELKPIKDVPQNHVGEIHNNKEILFYKKGVGYRCKCTLCGAESWQKPKDVLNGTTRRCWCQLGYENYLSDKYIGKRIGNLTILDYKDKQFVCQCDCGNICQRTPRTLLRENRKNATCGKCEYHDKVCKSQNGMSGTRLYGIWNNMIDRCSDKSNIYYGGRGISVCEEWKESFQNFYEWAMSNGYRDDLTIDRIDNDGNYCPENCRWADYFQQANNKNPPYTYIEKPKVEIDGIRKTAKEWCEEYGYTTAAIYYRMKTYGLTFEDALKLPRKANGRPKKPK